MKKQKEKPKAGRPVKNTILVINDTPEIRKNQVKA